MKKFIFLLSFFIFGVVVAQGQETYFVFSMRGKVQVYSGKNVKQDVILSQSLSGDRKLWIAKNAELQLRDKNGHVFSLPGVSGDWFVRDFVKKSQSKESRSFFGQFASGLVRTMKKSPEEKINLNEGTRRGNDDKPCFEDTIYASFREFKSKNYTNFDKQVFQKIIGDNGLIWFRVTNTTSQTYYCNIIRENANGNRTVCYESGWFGKKDVFPLPGTNTSVTVELNDFPLYEDPNNPCSYILVCSSKPFRVDKLQELLKNGEKPVSTNTLSSGKVVFVKVKPR